MKQLIIYEYITLREEQLQHAYNRNLKHAWKPLPSKRRVPDDLVENKEKFEERLLPSIAAELDESGKRGIFDVREQSAAGFRSLLEGRYLVL